MTKPLLTKIILLLLFISSTETVVFGQNDSSLIQLKNRAYAALKKGELDSARLYYNQVIKLNSSNPRDVGLSYNNLGAIDLKEGFNTRALSYSEKAIEVYRKSGNDTLIASALYNAARTYKRLGQREKAIVFLLEAALLFEQEEMADNLAKTYNLIANIYKSNNDFELALEFHDNAIKKVKETDDSLTLSKYINNRGKTYLEMKYFDLAIKDFKTALGFKLRVGAVKSSAYTYYNLGEAELIRNNLKEAENYLLEALKIHKEFKNERQIAFTINYLGEIAGKNRNWIQGEEYFQKAEEIAKNLEDYELLLSNYELQSTFYEENNELAKALSYSALYTELYQKVLNREKQKAIGELQIKYEVEKKEQKNQLLAQQSVIDTLKITQQKSSIQFLKNTTVAALIIIALALLLGFWFYRLQKKAKRQALYEKELALKERRFNTEQHHRIKNHLQLLAGLLSFQQRKLENIAAKEVIQESSNRVKVITTLHQHFYQSDDLSNTVIQLDTYLENVISNLYLLFKQKNVEIIQELEPVTIDADRALPLGLICNEIITNAFKYGLTDPKQPTLKITLKKIERGQVLSISDNGTGIQNNAPSSSIGLELITQMVKQMDAGLHRKNDSGTSYTLSF